MQISIIIVTLNEAQHVEAVVKLLMANGGDSLRELFVVDGGSTDNTCELATKAGATVLRTKAGRATQMNFGASHATGDLLYFVHADTRPPTSYVHDITTAVKQGYPIGCFRFQFDSDRLVLKVNSYFTRFDKMWCRGGDQSLFVTRKVFDELKGYRSDYKIMEEYDFINRARQKYTFKIIPKDVFVSARKYEDNGYFRVQIANLIVFNMYRFGYSQDAMVKMYRKILK